MPKMMTAVEAMTRVQEVAAAAGAGEFERAHALEDALLFDALKQIADPAPWTKRSPCPWIDGKFLARIVVQVRDIGFPRHTA